MKAQMKRKTAMLFAVLLAVALLFVGGQPAFAQEEPAGVLSYALNGSEATITECDVNAADEDVVTAFTEIANLHYTVTSIGSLAFRDCVNLTDVNLPSSVTNISIGAFLDCTGLTKVSLPSGLTSIGMSAFAGCVNLSDINLPSGLTNISRGTFSGCAGLTDINLPNGLTDIGEGAFSGCGLTDITIPAGVTFIGQNAFLRAARLSTITVDPDNENYTSDGNGVLFNKEKTVLIQYPIGNIRGDYEIPDTVAGIGISAFAYCTGLTGVTMPNGLTSIGEIAFYNCVGLTGITIPAGVTSIGENAFAGAGLIAIAVNPENPYYTNDDSGVLFDKEKTELIQYPIGNTRSNYTIPDTVTGIGDSAFSDCTDLTGIILPDSVLVIHPWAFYNTGLTNVTIPANTIIGMNAFADCESLSEITLADGKTDLPLDFLTDDSFQDGLRLYVPASVTSVGGSSSLDPPADVTLSGKPIIYAVENSFIATWAAANLPADRLHIIGSDAPASNASLSALSLSSGTLSPAFNAATKSYTASVANGVSSVTVTAIPVNPQARVNGDGIGSAKSLNIGANTLSITVTAEDGITTATYSVVITRATSNSNNNNSVPASPVPPPTQLDDSAEDSTGSNTSSASQDISWTNPFNDVHENDWFYEAVKFVNELGIMGGSGSAQTFRPEQTMTRAMLITALARYDGVDTSIGETWYSAAVSWGIANGVTDGSGLNDDVTREQIVTMLWRYAGQPQVDALFDGVPDAADISPWAADAFKWAIDAGIITGYGDNTVKPQTSATRAEVATILMRYIQAVE